MKDILKHKLIEMGIEVNEEMLTQFENYYNLLIEWNNKFNLTAITEKSEVLDKHFIDSILPYKHIPFGATMCDIGSGAGFPALPIKIIRPDIKLLLVDSLNKRVKFLEEIVRALNLKNIKCVHARAEDLATKTEYREQFDMCIARAVAKLKTLSEYCLPFVKVGGKFIAYKSVDYGLELNESTNAIQILGGKLDKVELLTIPETNIRRVFIIINKVKSTPTKYPRLQNKPKDNPII
ncbi:MAG: 16S rRNA (guanine(527)-N(7))-methyltransferase RsmG [Clostridia bacterium]|nr:16S rRNA (guanine(527)-N(7))-methyltransferase RsmG [Clostridia bacterium]